MSLLGELPSLDIPAIAELAALPQWVCWREDVRKGKPTKVPCSPRGVSASTTDPSTWHSFEACYAAIVQGDPRLRLAGIGFVLTARDPYVGVDLDHVIDDAGMLDPWAASIVAALDSYTERSPSERGLHILCRGELPEGWHRHGRIERYDRERYLTVTGAHWSGTPETIETRQEAIAALRGPDRERVVPLRTTVGTLTLDPSVSPQAEKLAALLSNDRKFRLSWEHRRGDLADTSLSTYDLSLVSIAIGAGWTDQELANLLIAHRRSYGDVAKVLRHDYVERTIATARAARSEGLSDATADLRGIDDAGETQEDATARIASQWKIPIRAVRRLGDQKPLYAIVLDSGIEIVLGSSGDLLQQSRVRAMILDATRGLVIPRLKADRWEATIGLLVAHAEEVSQDEVAEIDPVAELESWVREYLDGSEISNKPDEAVATLQPITIDGSVLVHSADLARWVAVERAQKISQREMALRLRASGHRMRRIDTGPEKKRRSRRYWEIHRKEDSCVTAPLLLPSARGVSFSK